MKTKKCPKCGRELPVGSFCKNKSRKDGLSGWCKNCRAQYQKNRKAKDPERVRAQGRKAEQKWWWAHPERARELVRAQHLRRQYGLSAEEYDTILAEQEGVCAICGEAETRSCRGKVSALAVDHDHATGEIRGPLCTRCNLMVGLLERDPLELIEKARQYLMKAGERLT